MILVDANLLIYAYDRSSPFHTPARFWLEGCFSSRSPVRLCWMTVSAFLRITTNPRSFRNPLSILEATSIVEEWFAQPGVAFLYPGERHWSLLRDLVSETNVTGPLISDARLAALAIEHEATLHTTDGDFSLFKGLRLRNPLVAES